MPHHLDDDRAKAGDQASTVRLEWTDIKEAISNAGVAPGALFEIRPADPSLVPHPDLRLSPDKENLPAVVLIARSEQTFRPQAYEMVRDFMVEQRDAVARLAAAMEDHIVGFADQRDVWADFAPNPELAPDQAAEEQARQCRELQDELHAVVERLGFLEGV